MPLAALSALAALAAAVMVAMVGSRLAGNRTRWSSLLAVLLAGVIVTAAGWATGLTGIQPVFAAPVIALGAFFASVVTLRQRELGAGIVRSTVFAAALTALIYLPTVTLVFAPWWDPFATGIGYVDLGAALPTTVAAASVGLAVLLVERRAATVGGVAVFRPWSLLWPALVLWATWILWLVGLELAIDRTTPLIIADAVLMPAAAALAFALVERVRHRRNSIRGVALGIVAGCAAATPAAGYVTPGLGVLTALLVGAIAALVPFDDESSASRSVAGSLLIGGGASLLLLGFLADHVGFIYTGQPELAFGQVLSLVLGGVGGFIVGAGAWALIRLPRRRSVPPTTVSPPRSPAP